MQYYILLFCFLCRKKINKGGGKRASNRFSRICAAFFINRKITLDFSKKVCYNYLQMKFNNNTRKANYEISLF